MAELSPAAQAVMDATDNMFYQFQEQIAAALEALADQVVPREPTACQSFTNEAIRLNRMGTRSQILAIAAELRGSAQ